MEADLNLFLAFVAGLLSFLSPCVLPLIPSYLSFVSGVSFQDLGRAGSIRWMIITRTVFFVLGFTIVFVILGVAFSGPALLFSGASQWINFSAGLIVVLLGINVMFDIVSALNMERRVHASRRPTSYLGATVVGMAFGAGWSPCIGPILASILFLAGTQGQVDRAVVLLVVYSLGLGLPFLAAGAAFTRVSRYMQRIKPYFGTIRIVSGMFLVAMGLLIMFGRFQQLNGWLLSSGTQVQRWATANPGRARAVFGITPIVVAAIQPAVRAFRGARLRPGWLGTTVSLLLTAAGIAHLLGYIDLATLFAGWLQYQGV
ncbi:MAG TPA: cytochrome c biogenesis protein CcdA [Alkalispirochaeta sp.]|nr:cytochrome c biogenesis protein CcdA [Alkalispirochaeta sp.]